MDKRAVRTREALKRALVDLLSEKPLSMISVSELTQRAGVNRGTFYLHYKSIDDMMAAVRVETSEYLTKVIASTNDKDSGNNPVYDKFLVIFTFFYENKEFYSRLFGDSGDRQFVGYVVELIRKNIFTEEIKDAEKLSNLQSSFNDIDYMYTFTAGGFASVLELWLNDKSDKTPEQMAELVTKIMTDSSASVDALTQMLERKRRESNM